MPALGSRPRGFRPDPSRWADDQRSRAVGDRWGCSPCRRTSWRRAADRRRVVSGATGRCWEVYDVIVAAKRSGVLGHGCRTACGSTPARAATFSMLNVARLLILSSSIAASMMRSGVTEGAHHGSQRRGPSRATAAMLLRAGIQGPSFRIDQPDGKWFPGPIRDLARPGNPHK